MNVFSRHAACGREKRIACSNRPWRLALLKARLGKTDDAFHWLREAVRQREGVTYVKVHPWLDSLRSDPRYGEILKTMNLAD